MNIYLIIYFAFHGFIIFLMLLNLVASRIRIKKIKSNPSPSKDGKWLKELSRANHFYTQSIYSFLACLFGEAICFYLLWFGGLFDKCQ